MSDRQKMNAYNDKKDIRETRKKPKKKKKGGCFKTLFLWILFLIAGIAVIGIYFGLNHNFFNIDRIIVNGNSRITDEEIINAAGVKKGNNIFRFDADEAEEKIKRLDGIESVNVEKIIPNKVRIEIREIFDIGYINDNGTIFIIDKDGYIKSGESDKISEDELIEFTSINTENLEVGMNIAEDGNFKNLINAIRPKDFFSNIESIDLGDLDESIIKFEDGLVVRFDNDDIFNEMDVLEKLLATIRTQNINAVEIIMNIGDHPVIVQEDDQ